MPRFSKPPFSPHNQPYRNPVVTRNGQLVRTNTKIATPKMPVVVNQHLPGQLARARNNVRNIAATVRNLASYRRPII